MKRILLTSLLFIPAAAFSDVHYTLTPDVTNKSVSVSVTPDNTDDKIAFRVPSWTPGYYVILKYQDKVSDVKATDESGKQLQISHEDPRQWVVANPSHSKVTLSYSVLGDDPGLGFFAVSVRPKTVYVNGSAAFMYVEGHKEEPTSLKITVPADWGISTPMDEKEGTFSASGYDEFVDHPIQLGAFEKRTFTVGSVPFDVVYVSPDQKYRIDIDAAVKRISQVVQPTIRMYGGTPFKHYVFLYHLMVGNFSGGLEHRASNVIAFPPIQDAQDDDLISHEFIHAWNVKQIRPFGLGPFDYTKEVRTGSLWFAEGVTDYYAKRDTYRSGLQDEQWLFDQMSSQISQLQSGQTRHTKTLEDASLAAWEGGSEGIGDLSYYVKGLVVGLIFDAAIRESTGGRKSLDDVMRYMYAKYRLPNPGYQEDGIMQAINEVSGRDMSNLYRTMVQSTDELPYEILTGMGLRIIAPGQTYMATGFDTDQGVVSDLDSGTEHQGLAVGDTVVSVNGRPWHDGDDASINAPGGYNAEVVRGGKHLRLTLKPVEVKAEAYRLEKNPQATAQQESLLQGWLKRS